MFPPFLSGPPPVQPLPLLVSSGHGMPPRPIGRRCQDSARQRPRQEIKCLNSLALSNPFSGFSLCSEFTYQEIHKYCSRFDLLTHALNVCHLFPAWLPGAQQLVVTLRSSETESFRLGSVPYYCSPGFPGLCGYRYAALFSACRTLVRSLFSLSSPAGSLPGQRSVPSYRISCVLWGFLFIALKCYTFRIGAASTAAAVGLPDWLIKIMGRWSSDCYRLYIRSTS